MIKHYYKPFYQSVSFVLLSLLLFQSLIVNINAVGDEHLININNVKNNDYKHANIHKRKKSKKINLTNKGDDLQNSELFNESNIYKKPNPSFKKKCVVCFFVFLILGTAITIPASIVLLGFINNNVCSDNRVCSNMTDGRSMCCSITDNTQLECCVQAQDKMLCENIELNGVPEQSYRINFDNFDDPITLDNPITEEINSENQAELNADTLLQKIVKFSWKDNEDAPLLQNEDAPLLQTVLKQDTQLVTCLTQAKLKSALDHIDEACFNDALKKITQSMPCLANKKMTFVFLNSTDCFASLNLFAYKFILINHTYLESTLDTLRRNTLNNNGLSDNSINKLIAHEIAHLTQPPAILKLEKLLEIINHIINILISEITGLKLENSNNEKINTIIATPEQWEIYRKANKEFDADIKAQLTDNSLILSNSMARALIELYNSNPNSEKIYLIYKRTIPAKLHKFMSNDNSLLINSYFNCLAVTSQLEGNNQFKLIPRAEFYTHPHILCRIAAILEVFEAQEEMQRRFKDKK